VPVKDARLTAGIPSACNTGRSRKKRTNQTGRFPACLRVLLYLPLPGPSIRPFLREDFRYLRFAVVVLQRHGCSDFPARVHRAPHGSFFERQDSRHDLVFRSRGFVPVAKPVVGVGQQRLGFIMVFRQSVQIELVLVHPDDPEKHQLRKEQVEYRDRQDGSALP